MKIPGPDHPITVKPTEGRVTVRWNGQEIADSGRALTLEEAGFPPVQYLPLEDVRSELFEPSPHVTYCPYKGDASYYTLKGEGQRSLNAVWTYKEPFAAVASIAGYVAFYPDRVDKITVTERTLA
ncbi:hypothetical protein ABS71_00070 [bacterium SCN 62-11]|nr:DUF427 domain-containing protein [Candidatus Eremiobacteraeota bacterium]ODT82848.1 MAG: hypothetical protein ABS71_00070 [bacterium SCN 62-11]